MFLRKKSGALLALALSAGQTLAAAAPAFAQGQQRVVTTTGAAPSTQTPAAAPLPQGVERVTSVEASPSTA